MSEYNHCSSEMTGRPILDYGLLQGHEARSSLFHVSPSPEQVPADHKARLQSSTHDQQRV